MHAHAVGDIDYTVQVILPLHCTSISPTMMVETNMSVCCLQPDTRTHHAGLGIVSRFGSQAGLPNAFLVDYDCCCSSLRAPPPVRIRTGVCCFFLPGLFVFPSGLERPSRRDEERA